MHVVRSIDSKRTSRHALCRSWIDMQHQIETHRSNPNPTEVLWSGGARLPAGAAPARARWLLLLGVGRVGPSLVTSGVRGPAVSPARAGQPAAGHLPHVRIYSARPSVRSMHGAVLLPASERTYAGGGWVTTYLIRMISIILKLVQNVDGDGVHVGLYFFSRWICNQRTRT
jgi:hypothetical protein